MALLIQMINVTNFHFYHGDSILEKEAIYDVIVIETKQKDFDDGCNYRCVTNDRHTCSTMFIRHSYEKSRIGDYALYVCVNFDTQCEKHSCFLWTVCKLL